MMKNYLLGTLGAVVLSLGITSCDKEETKPLQPVQPVETTIEHTLKTTSDVGEEYNAELASKVLELATSVLTKEKGNYNLYSDEYGITAQTSFEENGRGYFLAVNDLNEKADVISTPEMPPSDSLTIIEYSLENNNADKRVLGVATIGLNGNVHIGSTGVFNNKGGSLVPSTEEELKESEIREVKVYFPQAGEYDYKEFFQQKFEELVNTLLEIYKKE